jgi:hypothetical protein
VEKTQKGSDGGKHEVGHIVLHHSLKCLLVKVPNPHFKLYCMYCLTSSYASTFALVHAQVRPINPVKTPLPKAPHFKLYCMYGVGTPTERGYHYLKTRRNGATEWSINSMVNDPASGLVRAFDKR